MCDSTTMGHIEEVVQEFVDDQRMFTAYDVTIRVREIVGRSVQVRHNDIKNDIHREMAQHLDGDWQKTLCDVGAPVPAFVYYHFMSDPNSYEPHKRSDSQQATATSSGASSTPVQQAIADSDSITVGSSDSFNVDGRSRLLIPASYMKHLGVKGGDEVKVYKELDFIVVSNSDIHLRELASLKVDSHGYLYLSAKILGEGDLGDVHTFEIEANSDTVNGLPIVDVRKA